MNRLTTEHLGKRLLLRSTAMLAPAECVVREVAPSGRWVLLDWERGGERWEYASGYYIEEELPPKPKEELMPEPLEDGLY